MIVWLVIRLRGQVENSFDVQSPHVDVIKNANFPQNSKGIWCFLTHILISVHQWMVTNFIVAFSIHWNIIHFHPVLLLCFPSSVCLFLSADAEARVLCAVRMPMTNVTSTAFVRRNEQNFLILLFCVAHSYFSCWVMLFCASVLVGVCVGGGTSL